MSDSPALRPGGRREAKRDVLGWTIFGLVAIAVYVRLYFAIDFTDDSYYVALPYSFSLGHRPLVDELAIHQLAGLILHPLVELYLALVSATPRERSSNGTRRRTSSHGASHPTNAKSDGSFPPRRP